MSKGSLTKEQFRKEPDLYIEKSHIAEVSRAGDVIWLGNLWLKADDVRILRDWLAKVLP